MVSKRRNRSTKNRKSRRSRNKLNGGITFKTGKYGFFCNKETYNKLFGNVVKGEDAPSINKLNSELSLKGYRLENNSGVAKLIISNGERALNAANLIGNTIGYTLVSPFLIGIVLIGVGLSFTDKEKALRKKEEIAARTTSSYKHGQLDRILDKGLNAEIGYYKGLKPTPQVSLSFPPTKDVPQNQESETDDPQNSQPTTDVSENSQPTTDDPQNSQPTTDVSVNSQPTTDDLPTLVSVNLDNDTEIKEFIDVFISLTHLQKLKIDCCVVINVNRFSANTYERIVDKNPIPSVELSNIEASAQALSIIN